MLSHTTGFKRQQRHQGGIRSENAVASIQCRVMKKTGSCPLYDQECAMRKKIIQELQLEKEEEGGAKLSKNQEKPTMDKLVAARMPRRCKFLHHTVGNVLKRKNGEESITKLMEDYLEMTQFIFPCQLLYEDDDDAQVEEENVDPNALLTSLSIRDASAKRFNLSNLRELLPYYSNYRAERKKKEIESLEEEEGEKKVVDSFIEPKILVAEEVDFTSANFCNCVAQALKTVARRHQNSNEKEKIDQKKTKKKEEEVGVMVQSLLLSDNEIVDAEKFINSLMLVNLHAKIQALDFSQNKLATLKFLFILRAHFPKLIRLKLCDNPITRKPDYEEQIRRTLSSLLLLDGQLIRKPPLRLPYPITSTSTTPSDASFQKAVEYIGFYFEALENNLVDEDFVLQYLHPSISFSFSVDPQCVFFDLQKHGADPNTATEKELEHTSLLSPLDRKELEIMQAAMTGGSRDVKLGKTAVHRIAHGPLQVLEMFLESVYPERCLVDHHFSHAILSIVPLSKSIIYLQAKSQGHVKEPSKGFAEMKKSPSMSNVKSSFDDGEKQQETKQEGKEETSGKNLRKRKRVEMEEKDTEHKTKNKNEELFPVESYPEYLVVTMHGTMTWRMPTMRQNDHIEMYYDRVMTLIERKKVAAIDPLRHYKKKIKNPKKNNESEHAEQKEDEMEILLFNDCLHLRPVNQYVAPVFTQHNNQRVERLSVMFGLEDCEVRDLREGKEFEQEGGKDIRSPSLKRSSSRQLVQKLIERSPSDAVLFGSLTDLCLQQDRQMVGGNGGDENVKGAKTPSSVKEDSVEEVLQRRISSCDSYVKL